MALLPAPWLAWLARREPQAEREARERQMRVDYRQTFGTEAGQRVLADLLRASGVFRGSFAPGEPETTAYHEGQRRIGRYLLDRLHSDPDAAATRAAGSGETGDLIG